MLSIRSKQSRTRRKRTGSRIKKPRPPKQRTSPFDPPLKGTPSIRPLTSALLIRHWAREQHNCLASRISWVQKGDYYIYQIVSPEEASLGIKWQKGRWKIHEIKGKYNRTVKLQTRTQVKTWLHTCQT